MDKVLEKIIKTIQQNNEDIVFELIIKNYEKSNFFIALVFNKTIARFKILFVPIDVIKKNDSVSEYFCYQFIFMNLVNHMLKIINDFQEEESKASYDYTSGNSDYYIEFNTFNPLKKCSYKFSQYINPEFQFFFDVLDIVFEHVPNILNDLSRSVLEQFNTKYELPIYNKTIPFRLKTDDLSLIFNSSKFKYDKIKIPFLEKLGDNYYGVVNNNKLLVNFSHGLLKIYSGKLNPLGEEVYQFIKSIKDGYEKKFYRLSYIDNDDTYYLLCYGFDTSNNKFLIHNNLYNHDVSLKDVVNKKVKITGMESSSCKKTIINLIKEKYIDKTATDIINYTFN